MDIQDSFRRGAKNRTLRVKARGIFFKVQCVTKLYKRKQKHLENRLKSFSKGSVRHFNNILVVYGFFHGDAWRGLSTPNERVKGRQAADTLFLK